MPAILEPVAELAVCSNRLHFLIELGVGETLLNPIGRAQKGDLYHRGTKDAEKSA